MFVRKMVRLEKVDVKMRYYIGEHDGIEHPFDHNTFRAYFYWREGNTPRVQSFSVEQLEERIATCAATGEPTHKFKLALARLRRFNGYAVESHNSAF